MAIEMYQGDKSASTGKRSEAQRDADIRPGDWLKEVKHAFKDAFVLDSTCRGLARDVGLRFMYYYDMDGRRDCYPSQTTLAADLRVDSKRPEESIRQATAKLTGAGWFKIVQVGGGKRPGGGGARSSHYEPQWEKIREFMPERWAALEQKRLAKEALHGPVDGPARRVKRTPQPANDDAAPTASRPRAKAEPTRSQVSDWDNIPPVFDGPTPVPTRRQAAAGQARPQTSDWGDYFDGPTPSAAPARRRRTTAEKPRPQLMDLLKDPRY